MDLDNLSDVSISSIESNEDWETSAAGDAAGATGTSEHYDYVKFDTTDPNEQAISIYRLHDPATYTIEPNYTNSFGLFNRGFDLSILVQTHLQNIEKYHASVQKPTQIEANRKKSTIIEFEDEDKKYILIPNKELISHALAIDTKLIFFTRKTHKRITFYEDAANFENMTKKQEAIYLYVFNTTLNSQLQTANMRKDAILFTFQINGNTYKRHSRNKFRCAICLTELYLSFYKNEIRVHFISDTGANHTHNQP